MVEALFDLAAEPTLLEGLRQKGIGGEELVLKRLISSRGKSRAYINGELATLQMLSSVAEEVINIYGQHHAQILRRPERHLDLLDEFGGLLPLREGYQRALRELRDVLGRIREIEADRERRERERELFAFQLKELKAAHLREGEEEELRSRRSVLRNLQRIMEGARRAEEGLYSGEGSAAERLTEVAGEMRRLAGLDPSLSRLKESVEGMLLEVEEAARELRRYLEGLDHDPSALEEVEGRLDELGRLKEKYRVQTIGELMAYRDRIEKELEGSLGSEEELSSLRKRREELEGRLKGMAEELSLRRREAAERLREEMERELATLGMSKSRFLVLLQEASPVEDAPFGMRGAEEGEFLLSANPGEDPKPLANIASGGELSRIMLALKRVITREKKGQTLIFDEVDAGIGGRTAEVVGRKLKELSRFHQVICVTHLPQIASYGDLHLRVEKGEVGGRTVTSVRPLTEEERVEELSRLVGGTKVTAATLEHVRQMVNRARREL
ncbi:MAG: DNA repair protein RecN [Deltaproteobacteria bacterium]|nr:MAG: DNA repair protein RecN [Deltaproteobacteria bacterium]